VKLGGLLENANDFLAASKRCGWERIKDAKTATKENEPLMMPEMVNLAFACELYLNAIAEHRKIKIGKTHDLDKLFHNLKKETRQGIFDAWRNIAGENIADCDYTRQMFVDNLGACANVFVRFRYADKWVGSVISLEHSYSPEQFEKYSPASAKRCEDVLFHNAPQVYGGFINQFANSLKIYAERVIGKTYNS